MIGVGKETSNFFCSKLLKIVSIINRNQTTIKFTESKESCFRNHVSTAATTAFEHVGNSEVILIRKFAKLIVLFALSCQKRGECKQIRSGEFSLQNECSRLSCSPVS